MGWNKDRSVYRISMTVGHRINSAGNEVPIRKNFRGKTKKEAEKKRNDYLKESNSMEERKTQYFGILSESWIKDFFLQDTRLKGSSKLQYLKSWNRLIKPAEFYNLPIDKISAHTIQSYYNALAASGVPSNSIRYAHLLMKKFYRYVDAEDIWRNVTTSLHVPKPPVSLAVDEVKEISVWSDEELGKILHGLDFADNRFRFRFFIVLAIYTGCRCGELLGLRYDDIVDGKLSIKRQHGRDMNTDNDGQYSSTYSISSPKTANSVRDIPLTQEIIDELATHQAWHLKEQLRKNYRSPYIFTTDSGKLYDPSNVRTALNRFYKRIGVPQRNIHTYRHTFGTNLCKRGVPIQTVSKLLGHEDIKTTAKYYVNVSEEEKANAIHTLQQGLAATYR